MDMATHSADGSPIVPPRRMATLALALVALALLANIAFNVIMAAQGKAYPYTYFMFMPEDRWADFFKLIFTYPGDPVHPPYAHWSVQAHIDDMAAFAYEYRGSYLNPDHLPPLSTLIALVGRKAFTLADPFVLFLGFFAIGVPALGWCVFRFMSDIGGRWRWTAFALLSYPLLFTLDRGHMFALICALTLLVAAWRAVRCERIDGWSLLLFAIAINLRPNVAAVPVLLVLCQRSGRFRDLPLLGIASVAVLVVAMAAAHALYPYYGWATWLRGLQQYKDAYVVVPINHAFTSSLPTALEFTFGYSPWIPLGCFALGAAIGLATLAAHRWAAIGTPQILFVGLALMSIMTPAFTDYHLLPFVLPPLLIAAGGGIADRRDLVVFLASIAVLIPKNYAYGVEYAYTLDSDTYYWSYQIFMNPAILLAAVLFVLGDSLARWRPKPRMLVAG